MIETLEQERVTKKKAAIGAGALILIALVAFAFMRKNEGNGDNGANKPLVKINGIGFASSPQTPTATKRRGDSFSPVISLTNTGGEGDIYIKSRFGHQQFWGFDEVGPSVMPILDQKLHVYEGSQEYTLPSRVVPAGARFETYDIYIGLSLRLGGLDMDFKLFEEEFTVVAEGAAVSVLDISWI